MTSGAAHWISLPEQQLNTSAFFHPCVHRNHWLHPHLQRKRESRTPVDYHTWESYLCQAVYLQTSLSSCLTHFSLTGELNHWHMGNILGLFSHTSESMFTRPSKTLKPHQPDIIQYVTLSCKFSLVSLRPTSPGSHIRLKAERKKEE